MSQVGFNQADYDPELLDRADKVAERLMDELKREVQVQMEDLGALRRRMTVTIPSKVISGHLKKSFGELRGDTVLPGFRKGRAPLALIQKRFGGDVRNSMKTTVIGQSFFAAAGNEKLVVLGDPLFEVPQDGGVKLVNLDDALPRFDLPEDQDFTYRCEIEVRPEFELPELKGIEVKNPQITITDESVEKELLRQCKIRGRYTPVTEGGAVETDDLLVADVTLTVDGAEVKAEENVQLGVRPTRLDGIPLPDLAKTLTGAKPGDELTTECDVPDDYERMDLRGKRGTFRFKIHELKRLQPIPTADLIELSGAADEAELRRYIREDMEAELGELVQRAKKEQVLEYLVKNTNVDVPEQLSAKLTDRAVVRRVIELQQRGVPDSEIEAQIDELRTSARESVARDLRLEFIMGEVSRRLGVNVTEEEVNTEIGRIARRYSRRFDRVRDDLASRGLLNQLAEQIRQDKCVDLLLADAKFVDVQPGDKA